MEERETKQDHDLADIMFQADLVESRQEGQRLACQIAAYRRTLLDEHVPESLADVLTLVYLQALFGLKSGVPPGEEDE